MVLRGLDCRLCCFFEQISPFLVFGFGGFGFFKQGPCQGRRQAPPVVHVPMHKQLLRPPSYAMSPAIALALADALVFVVVFLRIDSPVSVKRWWFCISRSSIASAIVASPIHSCQCSIGS